ncbi:MAG TPA: DUF6265 family protein [Clostridia bacterium]|nr:DUF6265 family protein [Clostridia bacterium]
MRLLLQLLVVCAVTMLPASAQTAPAAPSHTPPKTLGDLAFMTGHWTGKVGSTAVEEFWSKPDGDNMMGVYREVTGGRVEMYEILALEQEASGPVLRLKHFDRGLKGREERDVAKTFTLVESDAASARFQETGTGTVLLYRRVSPDVLEASLIKVKDGKPSQIVFRYNAVR